MLTEAPKLNLETIENEIFDDSLDEINELEESNGSFEQVKKVKFQLEDIPGMSQKLLNKLKNARLTLEDIVYLSPLQIQDYFHLDEEILYRIISSAMDLIKMGFQKADKIMSEYISPNKLTSGSQEFDDLLGGGFVPGEVYEFYGEFRTGKTQLAHQLCINVQLPLQEGGLNSKAFYIDSEGSFCPKRIIEIAEKRSLNYEQILENIYIVRAYNSDHQILVTRESNSTISDGDVKLLILDNIICHFRSEYINRRDASLQQQLLATHLYDLKNIAKRYKIIVIFTNQVTTVPDVFYGNPLKAAGGNVVAHAATNRIYLRKGNGKERIAKIVNSPYLPEGEAVFSITEKGISD